MLYIPDITLHYIYIFSSVWILLAYMLSIYFGDIRVIIMLSLLCLKKNMFVQTAIVDQPVGNGTIWIFAYGVR